VKETKQIFIEVSPGKDGTTQTNVDWNKEWNGLDDVLLGLQLALSAVMERARQQVQLNQRPMIERPQFVGRRNN
jgi:hypothetical protein